MISGSKDKLVKLWRIDNGKVISTYKGHKDWVICVAISQNDNFAVSGSLDDTIKIWEINKKWI